MVRPACAHYNPSTAVGRRRERRRPGVETSRLRSHARTARIAARTRTVSPRRADLAPSLHAVGTPSRRRRAKKPIAAVRVLPSVRHHRGRHHGDGRRTVPRAPRVRGETETRGRGQLRQAAQVPRHQVERRGQGASPPSTTPSRRSDRQSVFFRRPPILAPPNETIRARFVSSDLVVFPTEIVERTAHAVRSHAVRRAETRGMNRDACKQNDTRPSRSVRRARKSREKRTRKDPFLHASHPFT